MRLRMTTAFRSIATVGALALLGCGAPGGVEVSDNTASAEQPFSESNCASAPFDATNISADGTVSLDLTPRELPETYSNPKCYRSRVYQIREWPGSSPSSQITHFNVAHAGPVVEASESCADEAVGLQVYIRSFRGTGDLRVPTWRLLDTIVETGTNAWVDNHHGGFEYRCRRPQIDYSVPASPLTVDTYRVIVTARRPDNRTTTVLFGFFNCGSVGQPACLGDNPCPFGGYFGDWNCVATPPMTPGPTAPPSMTPPAPMTPPMPTTPACATSVHITVQDCLALDGTPLWSYTPGSTTIWACGSSKLEAEQRAAISLAPFVEPLSTIPQPGFCTYSEEQYAGCYCAGF